MTANQLTYWSNVETARANRAREEETQRANIAHEGETRRSNVARERETQRANRAAEVNTRRGQNIKAFTDVYGSTVGGLSKALPTIASFFA